MIYFYVGSHVHPFYREQFKAAPEKFPYVPSHPELTDENVVKHDIARRGSRAFAAQRRAKALAIAGLTRAGYVRSVSVDPPAGVRFIHSAQYLLRRSPLPYAVDFEDVHVFTMYQRGALTRPWARRALTRMLGDEQVRLILPWTRAAERGLETALGSGLREKTATVLPAIRPRAERPRTRSAGPLRVLFVGTNFLNKGGAETVLAVQRASETAPVEVDMVTFAPADWAARVAGDDRIRIHTKISEAELRALYEACDLLIFPGHTDTLGFVVLEAMASGLPVLANDHFALPELVEHERSGLVVEGENSAYDSDCAPIFKWLLPTRYPDWFTSRLAQPGQAYVDRLAEALVRLASDRGLFDGLAEGALERVLAGELSMERRRQRLSDLYAGVLDR